jgi:hypothetical protein
MKKKVRKLLLKKSTVKMLTYREQLFNRGANAGYPTISACSRLTWGCCQYP